MTQFSATYFCLIVCFGALAKWNKCSKNVSVSYAFDVYLIGLRMTEWKKKRWNAQIFRQSCFHECSTTFSPPLIWVIYQRKQIKFAYFFKYSEVKENKFKRVQHFTYNNYSKVLYMYSHLKIFYYKKYRIIRAITASEIKKITEIKYVLALSKTIILFYNI